MKELKAEFHKIKWLPKKKAVKQTMTVLCGIVVATIAAYGLGTLFMFILSKIA